MKVGDRVKYIGDWNIMQGVTGTVVRVYPPRHEIDENGEPYISHHATVRVDTLPAHWPYDGTDQFAPSVSELKPI